jgi:hypothetical protein
LLRFHRYGGKDQTLLSGCGHNGQLSSASHHAGWVDATDARDQPLLVASGALHGWGGKKADVLSPPLINPDMGFEPPIHLSAMT